MSRNDAVKYFVQMQRGRFPERVSLPEEVYSVGVVVGGKVFALNGNATDGGFTRTPATVRSDFGGLSIRPDAANSIGLDADMAADPHLLGEVPQVELELALEKARRLFVDLAGMVLDPSLTKARMRVEMDWIAKSGIAICTRGDAS